MNLRLTAFVAAGAFALCSCDNQAPTSAVGPAPTATPSSTATPTEPEEGFAGIGEEAAPSESVVGEVVAPEDVNLDKENAENQLVKAEVLTRVDLMPNLTSEEKDKLYVQVERARGMGKVMTIPFGSGRSSVGAAEAKELKSKIQLPQIQRFTSDPTVIFVVLGFADRKGDEKKNLAISRQRAESAVSVLKNQCGVENIIHAVGMGGSELFDAGNLDKNRVVEVWAVLP